MRAAALVLGMNRTPKFQPATTEAPAAEPATTESVDAYPFFSMAGPVE